MSKHYFKIGRASEIEDRKDRIIFRFLEIFPGFLTWLSLFLAVILSRFKPVWIAVFIISFAIFWMFRTIYLSLSLRSGFRKMKENEKIDWFRKLSSLTSDVNRPDWRDIYHLIIFPMYQEPIEIIRDAFAALINSDYPGEKMLVVLALEERAGGLAKQNGEIIEKEFGSKFFKFLITVHPADIPGEIAGKGANENFAVKCAKELIDELSIPYENIVVSSFDIDTVVFPKYFSCLTYHYLTSEKPTRTSYQPIPLFINNIWQATSISRIFAFSTTFWQTMVYEQPEKSITFSSHSMSFRALVDIDFKQTNVVSDDSRIFWQCFLRYDGDYRVRPLFYPVSMDANVSKSFWRTLKNIYKQQRRWSYGVGDIPYFFFGFFKNKKIPLKKKISLGFELVWGHWSWATAPLLIFLLGWLPLILGGEAFSQTLLSYNLPRITSQVLTVAMIGLITSVYFSIILLPPRPPQYGRFKYLLFAFEWLLLPVMMIFFSAIPAIDAQTRWMLGRYMGFWVTEKVRK